MFFPQQDCNFIKDQFCAGSSCLYFHKSTMERVGNREALIGMGMRGPGSGLGQGSCCWAFPQTSQILAFQSCWPRQGAVTRRAGLVSGEALPRSHTSRPEPCRSASLGSVSSLWAPSGLSFRPQGNCSRPPAAAHPLLSEDRALFPEVSARALNLPLIGPTWVTGPLLSQWPGWQDALIGLTEVI